VHPRTRLRGRVAHRCKVVARARVDLARLRADDRRRVTRAQDGGQLARVHRPVPAVRHDLDRRRAQPQQSHGAVDRDVAAGADDDPDGRRARQPVLAHVPALGRQHVVARSGQARHVRHLAAGHQRERGARRQPEELQQPAARHLGDDGGRRGDGEAARVLVPGGGHPVGGQRGGSAPPMTNPK
jgi:hypothetical protein